MKNKFNQALELFDQANAKDPNKEVWQEKEYPKELLYGIRMSETLEEFEPNASEAVQLAVRCQHICRWEIPRDSYEMNRVGYLKWRKYLYKFHAEKAAEILEKVGYDTSVTENVKFLLQKKQLKKNTETQLLEDVICLVFLKHYFKKFSKKYTEEKLIDILQKTWGKMSKNGQEAALKIRFSEEETQLISKALA
ncbi:DUF4202 domain-containing protein [uncultured Polaribacter sp.]|uniref:DUF4202 domain-containing protein n=1 Tax=uncultured Polaribacter sp. TaxID=174711 RepID=UPI002634FDDD|nr:DUF4202 domain-containing protein [uncultured Polaribacter sp.]